MQHIPSQLARSTLDAAPDAMIIIDDSGAIRFANQQVSALFGYRHADLIGRPVESLMPERFRTRHVTNRHGYVASVRVRPMGAGLQLYGQRRDGTEFPVEISLSPIHDGHHVLVAAAIRDVTDRERVKAELVQARHAADAAREVADRAREIADRANQGKSRFLATASHDLRQPLQTLALLNGTLRRTPMDSTGAEAVAQQEQAIEAMSRLLNALLDISKLESGAIKPDPSDFAVSALFEELRREFAGLAGNKGLILKVIPSEDYVHSDPSLVGQILRNLVSNAIKYTRAGWVAVRCRHEQPSFVLIEVLDTGIGIPAEQLPYIYDEFYQVGVSANTTREGYGLGLSIVQRLVTLLDAKLDVRSEVGKGSLFALRLPASHTAAHPAHRIGPQPTARATQTRARILLVEDDPAVLNATRMLLKSDGYQVTAAVSLAEALEQATNDPRIDLLVTDYHLRDGETGTQVIAALRAALDRPLQAVLMTGDTSSAIKELPRDPGLRIASKPVNAEELLSLLRVLMNA
jgi:two-component system, sensor histidine kinase